MTIYSLEKKVDEGYGEIMLCIHADNLAVPSIVFVGSNLHISKNIQHMWHIFVVFYSHYKSGISAARSDLQN